MDVPVPVRVEVEAPADCADAPSFLERVRARRPGIRAAREDETPPSYKVRIAADNGRMLGSVVAEDGEPRSLASATCSELVDALALTVALAIDSRESGKSSAAPPEPQSGPPVEAASEPPPDSQRPAIVASRSRVFRASLGVDATLTWMGALSRLPTPGIFVEAGPEVDGVRDVWLRVGAATSAGGIDTGAGRADVRWWVGQLDGCPPGARLSRMFLARACLGVEAGMLSAEGSGISRAGASRSPWVAARALVSVTWKMTERLFLLASVGLAVPISRPRFLFAPSEVLFTPPSLAPFAGIGGGFTFP